MADVWLARSTGVKGFQKNIVLKMILPHLADDPDVLQMFFNEALLAASLDHPNIVHIFDLGQLGTTYFIAMEFIAGRTLRQVLAAARRDQVLPPQWFVLHVAMSVCDALQYAHNKCDHLGGPAHIVHRDVTPENIMVAFTGVTKVLDFGIAKASSMANTTKTGMLKGKYAYMAPEQILHRAETGAVDTRSDLYSLGILLYECLVGSRPFRARNEIALLTEICDSAPVHPSDISPLVPRPLGDLILRTMAKNPAHRYQRAEDLRTAIEGFLSSSGIHPRAQHVAEYMAVLFGNAAADHALAPPPAPPLQAERPGSGVHPSGESPSDAPASGQRPSEAPSQPRASSPPSSVPVDPKPSSRLVPARVTPEVTPSRAVPRAPSRPPTLPSKPAEPAPKPGASEELPPLEGWESADLSGLFLDDADLQTLSKDSECEGLQGSNEPEGFVVPKPAKPVTPSPPLLNLQIEWPLDTAPSPPVRVTDSPKTPFLGKPSPTPATTGAETASLKPVGSDGSASLEGPPPAGAVAEVPWGNLVSARSAPQAVVEVPRFTPGGDRGHVAQNAAPPEPAVQLVDVKTGDGPLPESPAAVPPPQETSDAGAKVSSAVRPQSSPRLGGMWDSLVARAKADAPVPESNGDDRKSLWDALVTPPDFASEERKSTWDTLVASRATRVRLPSTPGRIERDAASPEPPAGIWEAALSARGRPLDVPGDNAGPSSESEAPAEVAKGRVSWDAVVQRARRERAEPHGQGPDSDRIADEGPAPQGRSKGHQRQVKPSFAASGITAAAKFEQGMACMKTRDYPGALAAWEAALELDPENRVYKGNIRMLKKLLQKGESD